MREGVKKDTGYSARRIGQREIVCHYLEVSLVRKPSGPELLTSALARRYLAGSLTDGSIRENSGFHGETLASTGPRNHLPLSSFFLSVWFSSKAQPRPASAQTAQPKLLLTSRPSTPLVPKAPEPALMTVAPPGSALYVAKRGDSIPAGGPALSFSDLLPDLVRTGRGDPQGQRGFPRHVPEGWPAGDRSRTAACADRGEVSSGASVTLKCGPSISLESWPPATTGFASSSTGAKWAATPWSSISRTAMAA